MGCSIVVSTDITIPDSSGCSASSALLKESEESNKNVVDLGQRQLGVWANDITSTDAQLIANTNSMHAGNQRLQLLHRAVLARIDSLSVAAQTVLKLASVIGSEFSLNMLINMLPQSLKRKNSPTMEINESETINENCPNESSLESSINTRPCAMQAVACGKCKYENTKY